MKHLCLFILLACCPEQPQGDGRAHLIPCVSARPYNWEEMSEHGLIIWCADCRREYDKRDHLRRTEAALETMKQYGYSR